MIGGLPLTLLYEPDAGAGVPGVVRRDEDQDEPEQQSADVMPDHVALAPDLLRPA